MQNTKSVLINAEKTPNGTRYKWDSIGDFIKEFTSSIKSSLGEKEGPKPNISNAVSGLPSAFARSNMFTYALNSPAVDGPTSGLNSFYSVLLDEWKGLVSAFVLESDSTAFQVKRVWLNYSDGDGTLEKTNHIYEPKGAFGNALFDRKQLWEDQDNIGDSQRIKKPFIDIIYYKGKVVGGTSPESLVFTAPGYKFEGADLQKAFVGENSGKFTDPLKAEGKLDSLQLNKLYAYISKLTQKVTPFFGKYHKSKDLWPNDLVDQNIGKFLSKWTENIETYAKNHSIILNKETKPEVTCFEFEPFKSLFNSVNVYYANFAGSIFTEEDTNREADCVEFKLEDLLLDPENTALGRIDIESIEGMPIYALEVDLSGNKLYFTIPLSAMGLKIFQRSGKLEGLINGKGGNNSSSLIGLYDSQNNILQITLELKNDNGALIQKIGPLPYKIHTSGGVDSVLGLKQMVVWPNFVNSNWGKYFLYSEMPHNNPTGWQAFPILGNFDDKNNEVEVLDKQLGQSIGIKDLPQGNFGFVKIAEEGKVLNDGSIGKLVVGNIKNLSSFKYEIYESSKPYKGIEVKNSGKSAGFVFLKYGGSNENTSYISKVTNSNIQPTRVGIDFGSNNSCVAYYDGQQSQLLQYKNRRISFFTSDSDQNDSNKNRPADTFEMLFFQNDEPMSNKIKSVLTLHDETRLVDEKNNGDKNSLFKDLVKGGFTCYEPNIAIEDSTPNRHILNLNKIPDQKIHLVYNMKWSAEKREESHKIAFIKSLLLQTYAELFMRKEGAMYPKTLAWAYPAAMSNTRILDYSTNIWSEVKKDSNPLLIQDSTLEVVSGSKGVQIGRTSLGGGMGGGMTAGGMGGGMTGGGMGGGMTGGGMGGGMTGGGMGGGMTGGGMGGGMTGGGMGGGMTGGGMGGGGNQNISTLVPLEIPDEIALQFNPNHQISQIGNPIHVNSNKAMTESQAVACFAAGQAPIGGHFIIGLDVGGSTTDLLAVTGISYNGPVSALVKQNSIKLAAGALADATKIIPGINNFLKDYANKSIGKIHGIDNMTSNTAPFFFNTILDRLETKEQLDDFYRSIAANARPLMWLNLYITGLSMFYAGMVSRKLREHTERNNTVFPQPLCNIKVDFYGKGARIFDWYKALDEQNARNYYVQCFAKGFGEQEAYNPSIINGFELGNFVNNSIAINQDQVKTEVAKGLAMKDAPIFEFESEMSEIAGEDGYMLRVPGQQQPVPLGALMDINPSLIQRLGSELLPPQPNQNAYPRFVSFMNTFFDFASQTLDFKADGAEVMKAITNMNILNDLRNDEDYKEAQKAKEFDFVAPLIILQGQAFLRSYLLPKIQRG
jgi:hypothetical protein